MYIYIYVHRERERERERDIDSCSCGSAEALKADEALVLEAWCAADSICLGHYVH